MPSLFPTVVVFLGAGLGGTLRFWLGGLVQSLVGVAFPVGTLFVNLTGSFLIGVVMGALSRETLLQSWHLFAVVGMLGGYTTFSSFSYETVVLLQRSAWVEATLYVTASCGVCVAATAVGIWLGKLA